MKVFRVSGRKLDQTRVRENFKTKAEAEGRKSELEIEALNVNVSVKATRLDDRQLAEAEAAFQKLNGKPLGAAIDFYLANFKQPIVSRTVQEAGQEFLEHKSTQNRRPATVRELKGIIRILTWHCGNKHVHEITANDLHPVIFQPGLKGQTHRHRRTKFGQFFNWAIRRQYCLANPIILIDVPSVDQVEPQIYEIADVKAILRAARDFKSGKLLAHVVVQLFGGLRPTEARRLPVTKINLIEKGIHLGGDIAKGRKKRFVDLLDNAIAWLRPLVGKPICPKNWRKDMDVIRRLAGFKGSFKRKKDEGLKPWLFDGFRHTALSNHYAMFGDENKTARWAGNSPTVFHDHYKGLVTQQQAIEFWNLTPENIDSEHPH